MSPLIFCATLIIMNLEGSIITYTGRLFWPLSPRLEDINLLDICHALSNQCRFTGHCREFYSVAEHSCRVHDILPQELKLAGLLHDASEAYLVDLARPVKTQEKMSFFVEAEDKVMEKIAEKYKFEFPFNPEIKLADKILVNTEYRDLMHHNELRASDFNGVDPLPNRINSWSQVVAKSEMIYRLEKLGIEVKK